MHICLPITFNNPLKGYFSNKEYILCVKSEKCDTKIDFNTRFC